MLIHFISDYLHKPEVQQRASESPREVLDYYELSPEAQQALREHDNARILELVQAEVTELLGSRGDDGADFLLLWGNPAIQVESVSPGTTTVNTLTQLTVKGTGFPPKNKAVLSFQPVPSGLAVKGRVQSVTTTPGGSSTLVGDVTLPAKGRWKVAVAHVSNPAGAGRWSQDFIVG